jgi:hypothetical protein
MLPWPLGLNKENIKIIIYLIVPSKSLVFMDVPGATPKKPA